MYRAFSLLRTATTPRHAITRSTGAARGHRASFTAIQFAADNIRTEEERGLHTAFDLSNNRTSGARSRKQEALGVITDLLASYLFGT